MAGREMLEVGSLLFPLQSRVQVHLDTPPGSTKKKKAIEVHT
jgi:hypothetical protein